MRTGVEITPADYLTVTEVALLLKVSRWNVRGHEKVPTDGQF